MLGRLMAWSPAVSRHQIVSSHYSACVGGLQYNFIHPQRQFNIVLILDTIYRLKQFLSHTERRETVVCVKYTAVKGEGDLRKG